MRSAVLRPLTLTAEVRLDEGKTSVFQHKTGCWLEIRRIRFQAYRLRLVRRAERKQDEVETDGYLGNVGLLGSNPSVTSLERQGGYE